MEEVMLYEIIKIHTKQMVANQYLRNQMNVMYERL